MQRERKQSKALASSFLNNDVFTEILSYLSLEDVTRLQCVCKSWHQLISDPHFQSLQMQRSSRCEQVLGFFHKSAWEAGPVSLALHPPADNSTIPQTLGGLTSMSVLAVCNGVILVTDSKLDFYNVCNPSTGSFRTIPSLPFAYEKRYSMHYGLATVPVGSSSSYKIVSIFIDYTSPKAYVSIYSSMSTGGSSTQTFHIKIPTLHFGNSIYKPSGFGREIPPWKISRALNPVGSACSRGCLHWLTSSGRIITYDLAKQIIRVMNLPNGVYIKRLGGRYRNVWFGSVDNRLYLVFVPERNVQLWILEDYDNVEWKLVLEVGGSIVGGAPVYFDGRRIGIATLGEWKVRKSNRPISFFDIHSRKWEGSYTLPLDSHACQCFFPYAKDITMLC